MMKYITKGEIPMKIKHSFFIYILFGFSLSVGLFILQPASVLRRKVYASSWKVPTIWI